MYFGICFREAFWAEYDILSSLPKLSAEFDMLRLMELLYGSLVSAMRE